jgi:hypothetical protein
LAVVCTSGALALAQQGDRRPRANPRRDRRQRDEQRVEGRRPRDRQRAEQVRPADQPRAEKRRAAERPGAEKRRRRPDQVRPQMQKQDGIGRDFVMDFLREHPRFRRLLREHAQAQKRIVDQLRTLRTETAEQLRTADSPAARRRIIAGAKKKTAGLLLELTDERIAFRRKVLALTEQHKEELVERAVDRIFTLEHRTDRDVPPGRPRPLRDRRQQEQRPRPRRDPAPR